MTPEPRQQSLWTSGISIMLLFSISITIQPLLILAGGGGRNANYAIYGMSMQRDWLYDSNSIAIQYEGCVWSYVDDREDMGCMADESGDGTTNWYQMANCKRAQVAYSVYASSSGTTWCRDKDFKESLLTKSGVAEFAYTMGTYSSNSPVSEDDVADLPVCEADGYGLYMSVGCSDDGQFTIDRFSDEYCLEHYDTYDTLDNFNSAMKGLKSCYSAYNANNDNSPYTALSYQLISESGTCSEQESQYCTTSNFVNNPGSSGSYQQSSSGGSFSNKLKYGLGTVMFIGSVTMFLVIVYTNFRKRRALMRRKHNKSSKKKSKKGSKSKNKTQGQ